MVKGQDNAQTRALKSSLARVGQDPSRSQTSSSRAATATESKLCVYDSVGLGPSGPRGSSLVGVPGSDIITSLDS